MGLELPKQAYANPPPPCLPRIPSPRTAGTGKTAFVRPHWLAAPESSRINLRFKWISGSRFRALERDYGSGRAGLLRVLSVPEIEGVLGNTPTQSLSVPPNRPLSRRLQANGPAFSQYLALPGQYYVACTPQKEQAEADVLGFAGTQCGRPVLTGPHLARPSSLATADLGAWLEVRTCTSHGLSVVGWVDG